MELIHVPNCILLYLHSNDMNSLESYFRGKDNLATNKIIFKKTMNEVKGEWVHEWPG